jgi:hypothetical protein
MLKTRGLYAGTESVTYTIEAISEFSYHVDGIGVEGEAKTSYNPLAGAEETGIEVAFSSVPLTIGQQWTIRCTPPYTGRHQITEYRVLRDDGGDGNGPYKFIAYWLPDKYAVPMVDVDTYAQNGPGDKDHSGYYVVAYSGTNPSEIGSDDESREPNIFYSLDAPDAQIGDIFILDTIAPAGASSILDSGLAGPAIAQSVDNIPPDAVSDLQITNDSDALSLTWSAITSGQGEPERLAVTYKIYESTTTNLDDASLIGTIDVNNFVVENISGGNCFFTVEVMDGGRNTSSISNIVGKCDIQLQATDGSDWNLISLSLDNGDIRNASQLQDAIGASSVAYWDASQQRYVQYVYIADGVEFNNFDVVPGNAYYVSVPDSTIWTVVGDVVEPNFNLLSGWNTIVVSLSSTDITKASELQAMIPGATSVAYWDSSQQRYVQYVYISDGVEFNNFDVVPGGAYYVSIKEEAVSAAPPKPTQVSNLK